MLISNKTTIIMNNRQLPCHNVLPSRFLKLSSRYRLTWAIKYNFFVSFSFHSDQYSCVGHLFLLSCFFQQGYVGIFGLCKQYYIFRSARTSYEYQQKFLLLQFNLFFSPSVQREWVLDNREVKSIVHFSREVQNEIKMPFTLFEKWKWNNNDLRSRNRYGLIMVIRVIIANFSLLNGHLYCDFWAKYMTKWGGGPIKKKLHLFFFQIWDVEKDLQYNFQNSGVGAWGVDWIT